MTKRTKTIIGLMIPFFAQVLNLSMFSIAVPAIRDDFGLLADTASWLVIAYSIPYVLFMPFHGRLGDLLGPRGLLSIGMVVFGGGTVVCMVADSMGAILAGRLIQAAGAASVNPLSLSIISKRFDADSRGRAMGTWNSAGPFTGIVGPAIAGALVDGFGWRGIYVPILAGVVTAFAALLLLVPKDAPRRLERRMLREFDWVGMLLTACVLTGFVLFVSSRPITGRRPFTDWRLFVGFAVAAIVWVAWERRRMVPFVAISLFTNPQFSIAAGCVSIRMVLLGSVNFLIPLFAADVLSIPAAQTGLMITLHSAALLGTMQLGGRLADVWNRRYAVVIGLSGQSLTMLTLALLPEPSLVGVAVPLALHGAAAGLSLASLHHVAMQEVPPSQSGIGAGTYSMSRFFGSLIGASSMGIVLERALSVAPGIHDAYRQSFLVAGCIGAVGVFPALAIRARKRAAVRGPGTP